jgi:hypothetical protein
VATIRSRGDRATDREMSWNVTHDLKQNVQRVTRETIERGAVRIQPAADLPPGEYAIVLRPRDGWRLAGASVLSAAGEGRLFHWIWDFSIRE